MNWGLIIAGPRISYGQGPNRTNEGYDSNFDVVNNLNNLKSLFENITLVTWVGENFVNLPEDKRFIIQIFKPPIDILDPDNRRKQILAMQNGLKLLAGLDITHVVRIRSDQVISFEMIKYIKKVYVFEKNEHLIFNSDWIPTELFYSGDFIFAGRVDVLLQYCDVYLKNRIKLHPEATKDYVLKWIRHKKEFISPLGKLGIVGGFLFAENITQAKIDLWQRLRPKTFAYPTRELFEGLVWRGRAMADISDWKSFGFAEEQNDLKLSDEDFTLSYTHKLKHILVPYSKTRVRFVKNKIKQTRIFRSFNS
jgi:hypothetical protein